MPISLPPRVPFLINSPDREVQNNRTETQKPLESQYSISFTRGIKHFPHVKLLHGSGKAIRTDEPPYAPQNKKENIYLLDMGGSTFSKKKKVENAWWMRIAGRVTGNFADGVPQTANAVLPQPFRRKQNNTNASKNGKRPNGWNLKSNKLGSEVTAQRIYATLHEIIPESEIKLPGTVNILYAAKIHDDGKSQNIPSSVSSAEVVVQKNGMSQIASIGNVASEEEIGRVGRFQLSDKYWILSPLKKVQKANAASDTEQNKRTLLIVAHGEEDGQTIPIPSKKTIGYFGPSKMELLDLGLNVIQSEKLYGTQWIDENGKHVIRPMAGNSSQGEEQLANISGSEKKMEMANLKLWKYGSMTEEPSKMDEVTLPTKKQGEKMQVPKLWHPATFHRDGDSLRELCYLANDQDVDIITLRKNQQGSLSDLFFQLKKEDLWERYDRILIHACRSEQGTAEKVFYEPETDNPLPENAPKKTYVVSK